MNSQNENINVHLSNKQFTSIQHLNDGSCCGRLQLNILKLLAKNASFEHHNKSLQQATRCNADDYFTIDSRCQLFDTFFGFLFMVVVKELVETLLCIFASAKPYQKERVFVWLPSHVMISHVHSCRWKTLK
ncbi:hypothetical protein T10_920 [Trichinella papuae]|uniref:Uncharacterized protein n=1 Tax=Trichinella papuae TaxID=268474 RepID=A0A0V1N8P0_9BILA|nr:hypothetical protein T10_920 [Trichinella papuae]